MDPKLQKRVQRYGWDLAAAAYEPLWQAQLAPAHAASMACAAPAPGERVLDVACGTGLIALAAARAVGPEGRVIGVDVSDRMVAESRRRSHERRLRSTTFVRMDAERLDIADASVDVAMCVLGLMYMPHPERALAEMHRVLRPGGRMVVAVWGERERCGWAPVFRIVDAEVTSDVCPMFFHLGAPRALAQLCAGAGFRTVAEHRIVTSLEYADTDEACNAALIGGPVALAWSRFDDTVRARIRARYLDAIEPWRRGKGYRVPGEFVVVAASRALRMASASDQTAEA